MDKENIVFVMYDLGTRKKYKFTASINGGSMTNLFTLVFSDLEKPMMLGDYSCNRILGCGATAVAHSTDSETKVVKVSTDVTRLKQEKKALDKLEEKKVQNVPTVVKDFENALILEPQGEEFSIDDFTKDQFCQLVDILESVHKCDIIHCDVRPPKLVVHHKQIYLIDFGYCREVNSDAMPYSGAAMSFASEHVLRNWNTEVIKLTAADDLESAVRIFLS